MADKITAIVPARGGSKRLPGKNLKSLGGRPLIFHTIDALIDHKVNMEIVFTSDCLEYLEAVEKEYGGLVTIVSRPDDFGTDTTKVHDEVVRLARSGVLSDWFMLCLPTAPFRNHTIVKKFLDVWAKSPEPMFSACEYDFPVQFAFAVNDDGQWDPLLLESPMITGNTRSQDIPKLYRPNGAMYLHRTEALYENPTFYTAARPYLMSLEDSIDIDTSNDFAIAETLWRLRYGKG